MGITQERGVTFLDVKAQPKKKTNCASCSGVSGGDTGALVRETTPAGFSAITAVWGPMPDFDPKTPGHPWIYYGFSNEGRKNLVDLEVGMAFQEGDPKAADPLRRYHRWLPYLRSGAFYYAEQTEQVLPGATFELSACLTPDGLVAMKDCKVITFVGPHPDGENRVTAFPLRLAAKDAHIRRVVGLATTEHYDGERLGTLGPMRFTNTVVCRAGKAYSFASVATWKEVRPGSDGTPVIVGTANVPKGGTMHLHTAGSDLIALFP